ncbi:MAG: AMP-binding protein [Rhizobiaceae bacterium]|nr:AMP-binding protein [Rhizobiaceae bacterium]
MLKSFLKFVFKTLYRVEVKRLDNYKAAGKRIVIVANHLSFLDGLLLALFLPGRPMFAIDSKIATQWYVKPFSKLVRLFPLDSTSPMATKAMIREIRKDRQCVIFPEGRITITGSLMKVYEGPGMIADKADARILPVRIEGAQYTPFSRLKGKVRLRWFPKITLSMLPPQKFEIPEEIKGRRRRTAAGLKLYDLMCEMLFDSSNLKQTIFSSVLDQKHIHGRKHLVAEDPMRDPINYGDLITRSFILGDKIAKVTGGREGEFVGLMLPNMVTSVITFFALQAYGRVPAMLNFSTGAQNLLAVCRGAEIQTVITSKQFINTAKLSPLTDALEEQGINIVYLEDVGKTVTAFDKIRGLVASYIPETTYKRIW